VVTALLALLALGAVVAGGLGCELLVQLDPALVDAGEPDALAAEEETPEAAPTPEAGTQEAGGEAGATDSGDASNADSSSDGAAEASGGDSAGEASSGDGGAD